jgi:hypothetical protein
VSAVEGAADAGLLCVVGMVDLPVCRERAARRAAEDRITGMVMVEKEANAAQSGD